MQLSEKLFWDTDPSALDWDRHATHIISRVFMKGTLDEILQVLRHYGKARVQEALTRTRYLDKRTLALAASYFNLPKEAFRCYTWSQSARMPWPY